MAKKKPTTKPSDKVGMTPERAAEIAAETETALESARRAEEKRRETKSPEKVDVNAGVKFKKTLARDKKTGRVKVGIDTTPVAGQEDQGPSAAPKVRLKGPLVSTGKKLARTGARAPKRGELARGVTIVNEGPKRKKKKLTKTVVRDAETGRARKRRLSDYKRVTVEAVPIKPEPKPRTLAPGAGPRREQVYVDPSKPHGEQTTRKLKGLAVPHKIIAPAVNQAIQHIDGMAATKGTPEYHAHVEAFNTIHPTILDMDPTIHHALGAMAHHTIYPKKDSHSIITQLRAAIGDRLSEGRMMETQRAQRQRGNTNGS